MVGVHVEDVEDGVKWRFRTKVTHPIAGISIPGEGKEEGKDGY